MLAEIGHKISNPYYEVSLESLKGRNLSIGGENVENTLIGQISRLFKFPNKIIQKNNTLNSVLKLQ